MTRHFFPAFARHVLGLACGLSLTAPMAVHAQSRPADPIGPDLERVAATTMLAATDAQPLEPYRRHRPIFRVWQDFSVPANEEVRQVILVLGSATIEGTVHGDVIVWLGNVRLGPSAMVEGSTVVIAGNLYVAEGARVGRDLVMIGGTVEAPSTFTPDGAHLVVGTPALGRRIRDVASWVTRGLLWGRIIVPDLPWVWALLAIVFVFSVLFNHIFDRPVRAAADIVLGRPVRALLMGMLLIVVTGPLLVILAATIVGLLVVPFAICAIFIGWTIGKIGVTRALGTRVIHESDPENRWQAFRSFLIGFVIVAAAYAVPILGLAAWALMSLFGMGAAALTFVERRRSGEPLAAAVDAPLTSTGVATPTPAFGNATPRAEPVAEVVVPTAAPTPEPPPPGSRALLPYAAFLDRAAAFALDCILIAIAAQLLDRGHDDGTFFVLLLTYHIAFWIWKGTTLGGIVCNLRVIRTNGEPLRPVDAVVRGLSSLFSIAALGIGCLWMLRDPDRQTWHDKIAGTYVVKVPKDWPLP
jgi:uncharacterized RDD family membrane protein YckC